MSTIDSIAAEDHFFHENAYFLTCPPDRLGKLLIHYELFGKTAGLDGDIVEVGVFKGASLSRFAKFRSLLCPEKRVLGFDIFGRFPRPDEEAVDGDINSLENFVDSAGEYSISMDKLTTFLQKSRCSDNVDLIKGDVLETLPGYEDANPDWRISFANIDVDIYQPTRTALEVVYDRVVTGGVIVLDDYNGFPGATQAIDEFLDERGLTGQLRQIEIGASLNYLIKG